MKIATRPGGDVFFLYTALTKKDTEVSLSLYPQGNPVLETPHAVTWHIKSRKHGCYAVSKRAHAIARICVSSDDRIDVCYRKGGK